MRSEEKLKVSSVSVYTKLQAVSCGPVAILETGMTIRHLFWPAVAAILAIVGVLEVRSARGETQTWDEGIHISAGYSYLKLGDYSWNVEHPPLVKMVSALPLLCDGAHRRSRMEPTASAKTRSATASISCTRTGAMPIRFCLRRAAPIFC